MHLGGFALLQSVWDMIYWIIQKYWHIKSNIFINLGVGVTILVITDLKSSIRQLRHAPFIAHFQETGEHLSLDEHDKGRAPYHLAIFFLDTDSVFLGYLSNESMDFQAVKS